jgi:hypothetical protein
MGILDSRRAVHDRRGAANRSLVVSAGAIIEPFMVLYVFSATLAAIYRLTPSLSIPILSSYFFVSDL